MGGRLDLFRGARRKLVAVLGTELGTRKELKNCWRFAGLGCPALLAPESSSSTSNHSFFVTYSQAAQDHRHWVSTETRDRILPRDRL